MPSAFIGEREPERRFLMRRFAPKRPFGTAAGDETEGGFLLFWSSLPSERFSLDAEGDEVLRLGHEGACKVSIVDSRALSSTGYFFFVLASVLHVMWQTVS